MENILFNYVETLNKITGNNIFITDRDKIISCLENKKFDYLNNSSIKSTNALIMDVIEKNAEKGNLINE